MNILFDFITTQLCFGGGAGEYVRRVYYELQDECKRSSDEINIFAAIDTKIDKFPYPDLAPAQLSKTCTGIIDMHGKSLRDIVHEYRIDTVFVGLSQAWSERYDFRGVDCKVITVTHDLNGEEVEDIRLFSYLSLFNPAIAQCRQIISRTVRYMRCLLGLQKQPLARMFSVLKGNPQWVCITVSDYSKHSLMRHYDIPPKHIRVLFSPERIMKCNDGEIEDRCLKDVIDSGKKYYLIVSANRPGKNAGKALEAFRCYRQYLRESKACTDNLPIIVTVGMGRGNMFEGHIDIKTLSESDLEWAYRKCYALVYPSFFEGFGYPPVEAMKFGAPVLASNVTSMPEVLGDAPVYFSPFYVSDIFRAFCSLTDENYEELKERSVRRYAQLAKKQDCALTALIGLITGKD